MLLEVKNLVVYYGSVLAVDGIDVHVNETEIVALIGPNGAGKSTTLKAISGLLIPRKGDIVFRGDSIRGNAPFQLVEKGLCLVPEGRHVFPSMNVQENLEMGAFTKRDKGKSLNDLETVYSLFPILKERRRQKAGTLSSGEQQMLALGRALMVSPEMLLLDEPSLGLSPNYVEVVFEKIREISRNGITILLVEQNARMALEYADRGYVFEIGKITFEDKAKNLLGNDVVRKSFLGED